MHYAPRTALQLFFLGFGVMCAASAQAAVITNLDEKPQTVEVYTGQGMQTVSIAANATWRAPGKIKVRFHDRDVQMNDDDEFAIWPNKTTGGEFGPQKRQKHGSSVSQ